MERNLLIDKIVNFYFDSRIDKNDENYIKALKKDIKMQLEEDVVFVEQLYNSIFLKAKQRNTLKTKKIMEILQELNLIRINLE